MTGTSTVPRGTKMWQEPTAACSKCSDEVPADLLQLCWRGQRAQRPDKSESAFLTDSC